MNSDEKFREKLDKSVIIELFKKNVIPLLINKITNENFSIILGKKSSIYFNYLSTWRNWKKNLKD